MAFLYMGFSCQDDYVTIESMAPFRNGTIEVTGNETEGHEFEFWPIEHPIEPLDEDRPVKCPVLNSSVLNNESMRFSDNLKKRAEQQSRKEQRVIAPATEALTLRTLGKRHHTQTNAEDYTCRPFLRMPPRDLTIFNMFQHFDKI
ncbi:ZIP metal ion transporter family [Heracleum sosnowskyi]|uniref:ZIP metal ion transporter family n=1 Tax=Heracleum sosnowskyi TaxID=360622 RepID=A0AAD8I7K6_9APIA|nr:ZIP metal ion transporter family [Heracleum sosnowskyi]